MPSTSVRNAVAKSKDLMEDGDYDAALSTLRDTWDTKLSKGDQVLLVRSAGLVHMSRGQNDESIRRLAWKESRKSFERAQKIDPGNKETRKQLNALMSMMDEANIQLGRGFSIFANGEPTPFGLLAMFLSGIVLLAVFGQGRDLITGWGEDDASTTLDGDNVKLTVSYYPQIGGQKVTSEIDIQLYPDMAPSHVSSFIQHVDAGFYNQTTFHRVIDDFMIQGGDLRIQMEQADMLRVSMGIATGKRRRMQEPVLTHSIHCQMKQTMDSSTCLAPSRWPKPAPLTQVAANSS